MQINNNLPMNHIAGDLGAGQSNSKAGARSSAHQDQVQISSLASQFSADPSKLSQLQAAYEAGTYSISPSQIASSMIHEMMLG
jgi:anti-sigma28 factor (negative regulator of flagellin synthesis)